MGIFRVEQSDSMRIERVRGDEAEVRKVAIRVRERVKSGFIGKQRVSASVQGGIPEYPFHLVLVKGGSPKTCMSSALSDQITGQGSRHARRRMY